MGAQRTGQELGSASVRRGSDINVTLLSFPGVQIYQVQA